MHIRRRFALNAWLVAALLVIVVLFAAERRLTARMHRTQPATAASEGYLTDVRRDMIFAGIAALLFGAVVIRTLARHMAEPIEALRDIARALAAGNLARQPSLMQSGEVGELGEALRSLAQQAAERARALTDEEALLVALTESLNEGVIAVDARQQVVRMNDTARQLLRIREPVPFPAEYLPRDRTLREALAAVLSGAEALPGEARVDDRTLSLTARPLPAGGAVLALYDLTPFRRLEAVRRDFVANVSHELRTPLTVISGFVETLQDDDLPPALRKQFLGMTEGNVQRMQRIVDDLLDLSRIESGGWLPNAVELEVESLAIEVVSPLQAPAHEKGVALRIDVGVDARTIYSDPTAVRQILSNLTQNALRHTLTGEIVIFSSLEDGGTWLGVRDTGIGISAEHLPRIFERFYRADPSRSREAGGTGLGLAIVRHLAEAHGGKVKAESEPGVGTTIAVWLPLSHT